MNEKKDKRKVSLITAMQSPHRDPVRSPSRSNRSSGSRSGLPALRSGSSLGSRFSPSSILRSRSLDFSLSQIRHIPDTVSFVSEFQLCILRGVSCTYHLVARAHCWPAQPYPPRRWPSTLSSAFFASVNDATRIAFRRFR